MGTESRVQEGGHSPAGTQATTKARKSQVKPKGTPAAKKSAPAKKKVPSAKGTPAKKTSRKSSALDPPSTAGGRAPPSPSPPAPPGHSIFHGLPQGINLNAVVIALEASLYSESLYEFAKAAWHIVEPGTKFQDNWHLKVICQHLEAVSSGKIRNLIINIPPRSMKSLLVSVLWPAWDWTRKPTRKWLFSSYGQALATRDAVKMRRLVQHPWYKARWGKDSAHAKLPEGPGAVVLTGDQNEKIRYENDKLGYRISTSVGGLGTGEGGDIIVCDDPHNVQQAESDAVRESTLTWWNETMSTRGNDPETVCRVIVMQRVHEFDLTADQLQKGGWDLLCLPMEYEKDHPTPSHTALHFRDPRRLDGELLWPGRYTTKALRDIKRLLGKYGTAGQLQQRPTPRGGGMFEEQYTKFWPAHEMLPNFFFVVKSLDTAYTEKTVNDPTACNTFGLFNLPKGRVGVMLLDSWGDHMTYPKLKKKVINEWKLKYGAERGIHAKERPGRAAEMMLIENKGSGISLIQDMNLSRIPTWNYNPGHADKVSRASQVMPWYEMGEFYVLESENDPGEAVTWAREFLSQLHRFGPGVTSHDDHVDTFTQVIIYLRDRGLITLEGITYEEDQEQDYHKKRTGTYG